MQRRSFFARALGFIGIAGVTEPLLKAGDVAPVKSTKETLDGPNGANLRVVPNPSIYLVDSTKVDVGALSQTMTLTGLATPNPGDVLVMYVPAPGDNFPPIMRVPDVTLDQLVFALKGTWGGRRPVDPRVQLSDITYFNTPFTREELGLK